jgi:FkbM family methyltransferase
MTKAWITSRVLSRVLSTKFGAETLPPRVRSRIRAFAYRVGREFEEELKYLEKLGPNVGVAVDVGANFGFYSRRLAKLYEHTYAFEPQPFVSKELSLAGIKNLTVIPAALSDSSGTSKLRVPLQDNRPLYGWATINANEELPGTQHIEFEVKQLRLDEMHLGPVKFMKIDVEGHELSVLKGGLDTLARDKPVILCEAKGENAELVATLLSSLGYNRTTLAELCGAQGSSDNWIFRPSID